VYEYYAQEGEEEKSCRIPRKINKINFDADKITIQERNPDAENNIMISSVNKTRF
jgi:hypothetical protein